LILPSPFRFSRRPAITFGIAAFLAIVTAISFFLMEVYHSQDPNYAPLLLLAVVVGTLFGGKKLGLLAVVLSTVASTYFVLHSANAVLAQLPHTVLLSVLETIIWWAIAAEIAAAEFLVSARDELQEKNEALRAPAVQRVLAPVLPSSFSVRIESKSGDDVRQEALQPKLPRKGGVTW
jgi:K+-sensing histidine kinase KdpD